jgi:hypothetical protein
MTIDEAKRAGANAFIAGLGRAPALNHGFTTDAIASARETGGKLTDLLAAYGTGWTVANLAENAPLPDMPSVIEFNRLMAVCTVGLSG